MSFFDKLLDVFRGRPAGSRFKEPTAVNERNNGQHLGARAQFEDREQVGEIIPKHVAGGGNRVVPVFGAFERMFHGVHRGHDLNVHARGVVLLQIAIHFFNQLRVVWPVLVQPEDHGRGGRFAPIHGQFHPILNRNVLDRTRAEDVAVFHVPFVQNVTGSVNHADGALARGFVGLVVRAVFLSLLSHQPDVGHAAHRGGIEFPVLSTEIHDGLINARVTAVRDHGFHVVFFAVRPPHFPTHAKGRGHGGVDNDVARHVEVGNAFV